MSRAEYFFGKQIFHNKLTQTNDIIFFKLNMKSICTTQIRAFCMVVWVQAAYLVKIVFSVISYYFEAKNID